MNISSIEIFLPHEKCVVPFIFNDIRQITKKNCEWASESVIEWLIEQRRASLLKILVIYLLPRLPPRFRNNRTKMLDIFFSFYRNPKWETHILYKPHQPPARPEMGPKSESKLGRPEISKKEIERTKGCQIFRQIRRFLGKKKSLVWRGKVIGWFWQNPFQMLSKSDWKIKKFSTNLG